MKKTSVTIAYLCLVLCPLQNLKSEVFYDDANWYKINYTIIDHVNLDKNVANNPGTRLTMSSAASIRGYLRAYNNSRVQMSEGSIGMSLMGYDNSNILMLGGVVEKKISIEGNSILTSNGGVTLDDIKTYGYSKATIDNMFIGKNLVVNEFSYVSISNTHIDDWIYSEGSATLDMHKRTVVDYIEARGNGTINIYGGLVYETIFAKNNSIINLYGNNFCINDKLVPAGAKLKNYANHTYDTIRDLNFYRGHLNGTLSSGEILDCNFEIIHNAQINIMSNTANLSPIAVAGANDVYYAWIDGIADIVLDGSDSNDPDGDSLVYKWSWAINTNIYEANGISPTIELPNGTHTIQLVVNDGLVDSEPDDVNITVIAPIAGKLSIMPVIINRQSNQQHIIAMLDLPYEIALDEINSNESLRLYPGGLDSAKKLVIPYSYKGRKYVKILAFFDKDALMDAVPQNGQTEMDVVGKLKAGQYFYGSDTVRIIKP